MYSGKNKMKAVMVILLYKKNWESKAWENKLFYVSKDKSTKRTFMNFYISNNRVWNTLKISRDNIWINW